MEEETKVAPVPQTAEVTEPIIDNRRAEIENLVIAENQRTDDTKPEVASEKQAPKEEVKTEPEVDPVEQVKLSMQKRINKLTAKTKTAEEELAELRAENERLKANSKTPSPEAPKDNTPPTPEQVEAYIAKMQEEGNHKEAAAAIRYLVKLEKEMALKEVEERQTKTQTETQRQNAEMKALASDYVAYDETGKPDIKSDMTLANQNGLLFKLSMDYFNDPARHADRYNNPNVVEGFRRAVADAYRDIQEHKSITPRGETITEKPNPRRALAEPEAEVGEDQAPSNDRNSLSDADKVREEINRRTKNRYIRRTPQ